MLFLELLHGRRIDPLTRKEEDLEDWGEPGPVFEVDTLVRGTYSCTLLFDRQGQENMLKWHGDLLYYDGLFYGDFAVTMEALRSQGWRDRVVPFDPEKADLSAFWIGPATPAS